MEALTQFYNTMMQRWRGFSSARRLGIVVGGIALLIALGILGYFAPTSTTYRILYAELPLDQVSAVTAKLTTENIAFKLENGGVTVMVPEDRLAPARVALAAVGIPSTGGKGFEGFDETSLTATPFTLNVNYQRALQTELARSITTIDGIASARVLIARPDSTPFIRDQKATTASVVLKLKPGSNLDRKNAVSIVNLVARSVEGLKPENVTVVDSFGRMLSDLHAGQRNDMPAAQMEYQQELEADLVRKAEAVLNGRLGPNRAVVRVTATLNLQKTKEQIVSYPSDGKVVSAERLTNSSSTNSRAGGVAGAASNISRTGGGGSSTGGNSKEEMIQTDYALSKTTREIEDKMGAVTRLTIAAVADLSSTADGTPPLTAADAEELIKQAVGFKTGRDEIKITDSKIGGPVVPIPLEDPEVAARQARIQGYVQLARNTALFTAIFMSLAIIALLLFRRRPTPEAEQAAIDKLDKARAEAEKVVLEQAQTKAAADQRRQEMLDKLAAMSRATPEKVADVFGMILGNASPAPTGSA